MMGINAPAATAVAVHTGVAAVVTGVTAGAIVVVAGLNKACRICSPPNLPYILSL